jgi:hypothetical protein
MRNSLVLASATALMLALVMMSDGAALADETGVAGMHDWVKVGRKTCMADHFHDGSGSGATRRQAEAAAISAWSSFTAWEYGTSWGRYSIAVNKTMRCSGGARNYTCSISARPCRPY